MIFGRNKQQQGTIPQQQPPAAYTAPAPAGYGAAPQQAALWNGGNGYPTQPAGTGYAGYTPGEAQQRAGGYAPAAGYGAQGYPAGMNGYGGNGQMPQGAGMPVRGQTGQQYPQAGQGYGSTGQQYPQPGQGYGSTGQQYPQPGLGYSQTGQQVPRPGQGYGSTGQQYPQAGQVPQGYPQGTPGYMPPQGGYAYPQMNGAAPYGAQQGSYTGGQQNYAQGGYNAYAQMGRNQTPPPDYSRQIPLNGGGYVPPAVPVKKQPFVFKSWMLIALGAVLAALLAAGLFWKPAEMLLWVFIVLAAGSILLFWIRPLISGNRRLCYTIIFGVLCVVALLKVMNLLPPPDRTTSPGAGTGTTQQTSSGSGSSGGTVIDPQTGNTISAVQQSEPTATPTAAADDTSTTDRLESFFRYWAANRQDEMLTLCAPSWQSSVDNPKTALFGLIANRTPLDYFVEKVSGTVDDTSRTVTVTSTIDRNNGKNPVKYRLSVLMKKEDKIWYVDPQSLKTYEEAETPDPALAATPTPSPEPAVNSKTVLYYNPDGGTKYHLDQNCKSTHAKYLPMKGHFTYGEINDAKYSKLTPCNVCAAPLRP